MAVGFRVFLGGPKVDSDVVKRFRALPVANVSDSMNRMSSGGVALRPMHKSGALAGAAVTVKTRPGDNLLMHKAFDIAKPGDVIVAVEGTPIHKSNDLYKALDSHKVGDTVEVTALNQGDKRSVKVTLQPVQ